MSFIHVDNHHLKKIYIDKLYKQINNLKKPNVITHGIFSGTKV